MKQKREEIITSEDYISGYFKVSFGGLFFFLTGGDQLYMSVGKDLFYNAVVSNCTLTHSCVGRKKNALTLKACIS